MFTLPNQYLARDVYKSFIDKEHFLVKLEALLDWHDLAHPLMELAQNTHGGRPRYAPVLMLKMLFLSFLFNLSDRDTEFSATNNLLAKYFLGLPINEPAPDHSSLSRFREEVLRVKGLSFFEDLFRQVIVQAKTQGVVFGVVSALDATHTLAKVDTARDGHAQKHYGAPSTDPDAKWGVKGKETKMTTQGQKVDVLKTFYGYKAHLLAETKHGLITGLYGTPGNTADLDGGDELLHRILTESERAEIQVLTADKAYGCPLWVNMLEKYTGITTAFALPRTMTEKGYRREKWQSYVQDPNRRIFRKERSVVERVNADLKENHSLRRSRYLGLIKYRLQLVMASIAHNVKLMMRILTEVTLRPI